MKKEERRIRTKISLFTSLDLKDALLVHVVVLIVAKDYTHTCLFVLCDF